MLHLGNAQIPHWEGGLITTLQDMVRFGEMLREGGKNKHGVQVVNKTLVARLHHPPADFLPKLNPPWFKKCNKGYLDQFWIGQNQAGSAYADRTWFGMIGIWGQELFIYPHLNMTVARQSTNKEFAKGYHARECAHDAAYQELGVLLGQIAGRRK